MSIILENQVGWIICHKRFFENIIVQVDDNNGSYRSFHLNPTLFEINEPFKEGSSKKGKKSQGQFNHHELGETAKTVRNLYEKLLKLSDTKALFERRGNVPKSYDNQESGELTKEEDSKKSTSWPRTNLEAVKSAEEFFEAVKHVEFPEFHGANPSSTYSVISRVNGIDKDGNNEKSHQFIFPPNSKFFCKNVTNMKDVFGQDDKFDLIIMDPPWWNKFIRRKKRKQCEAGYQMLNNESLMKLPIKDILQNEGIVVLWCTNSRSHHDAVEKFFESWDVHFHHKLYWLKVTTSGQPICPFNEDNKKQPYETIFIGGRGEPPKNLNKDKELIVSVPSSINSHKPPLTEVLRSLYPGREFKTKLEIFARYLMPSFTSFGNEVIKLQHLNLFIEDD